jgi:anaerobic dimethyl sulfoxide reductase subunit C (anchor subunit)
MRSWSLVCFTLLNQSAIGLVWVTVPTRWLGKAATNDAASIAMMTALGLCALGLTMALAHLSKPRLAPHALRNLPHSWLSREVLLVQAFAGAVAAIILLSLLRVADGRILIEVAACLLGGAALYAMTRVYLLRTVPAWNSPATGLEFYGSALLLGGALKVLIIVAGKLFRHPWSPDMTIAAIAVAAGILLKVSAIRPALAAERTALDRTWYDAGAKTLSTGGILMVRTGLYLAGLAITPAVVGGSGPVWLWSVLCLASFGTAEVVGRNHFYRSYRRVGL